MKTVEDARTIWLFEEHHPKDKFNLEDGDVLFNAPRPLYGETFQGDFISGIFYAVINPTKGDDFDRRINAGFIDRNVCLDAGIIKWFDREDVENYVIEILAPELNLPEDIIETFDFEDKLQSYYEYLKRKRNE